MFSATLVFSPRFRTHTPKPRTSRDVECQEDPLIRFMSLLLLSLVPFERLVTGPLTPIDPPVLSISKGFFCTPYRPPFVSDWVIVFLPVYPTFRKDGTVTVLNSTFSSLLSYSWTRSVHSRLLGMTCRSPFTNSPTNRSLNPLRIQSSYWFCVFTWRTS